jgi:hypothetical protein
MESLGGTGYVNSTARGGILTSEQVNTLKETAKRTMRVREGCLNGRHARDDDSVVQAEFHAAFDPTTCLELLEEVERLRTELKDAADDLKAAANEARWECEQGAEYGTY